jgi:hypothetical protein
MLFIMDGGKLVRTRDLRIDRPVEPKMAGEKSAVRRKEIADCLL